MQQSTFLGYLNEIERSIEKIKAANTFIESESEENSDSTPLDTAFKSLMSIKKEFYKKLNQHFTTTEIQDWAIKQISKSMNPEDVDDVISSEKKSIEKNIKLIESRDYLMSDSGIRVNLKSKTIKKALQSILDCVK